MPINKQLFADAKAAEAKLLNLGVGWGQIVGQVTMYIKTLNEFDVKLQKEKDAGKIKGMETFCKAEMVKLRNVWKSWNQSWLNGDAQVTKLEGLIQKINKDPGLPGDANAKAWLPKAIKNVMITDAGFKQGKTGIVNNTAHYGNLIKNKHFV